MGERDRAQDVPKLFSGSPITKMLLYNKSVLLSLLDYNMSRREPGDFVK